MEQKEEQQDNQHAPEGERVFKSTEDILEMDDLEVVPIWVPEWKTWVRFRVMSAATALTFQKQLDNPATKSDAWVRIFALCAVQGDGTRMFTDQQLEKLRKKSTKVFMRLQSELLRLNGFTKETTDALKNDSSGADSDASPTA